ncbi:unnamed protein product [Bursaphelenchus okinawaensis]|uniref:G_PROTEIN_RECEP_F1_2 domain-containing protein n=1 Tax=Bursaphelenchus okinawaensis TaxID=465554 RepID=A0A811LT46_9BILA|nr:unnamed protein product [Bursaphelenchus okinawaensis]CAG9128453.1 unnamed protein product [Bursaphelenchus okinawaensis]
MEHLTPYGVFIARGMPKAADSPFLAVIFQMLSYSLLEVNILITMCKFLFRYTVATNQEKMTKLLSHKLCFALLLSVLVFCFGTSWVTNRNSTDDAQEYKDSFPIFDTALREYINDNIIVLTKSNALDWIIQHIVFPLVLIFSAYCTYSCYKFRNTNTAFSERTRHFFYVLTKGLVIEQLSLVLWVLLPLVLIEIAIPLRQKVIASYVFIRILYLYPAFVMAFTLTYYKRYRRAVLYLFNHSNKKNVTTLSSVASSSLVVKNRPTFSKNSLSATLPSRNAVSAQGRRVL